MRKGTTEDGQEKLGAPIMSNHVLALVKKMFNFALDREWLDANPAARLKPVAPKTARDRVLSPDEIRTFWRELLTSEVKRFLAPFEVDSIVSPMRAIQDEPLRGDRFLLYLSGREDEDQLTKPLKSLARVTRDVAEGEIFRR